MKRLGSMAIKSLVSMLLFVLTLATPLSAWSQKSYKSILKDWTRDDEAYNWSEMEARMVWHATYLSDDFRAAKIERYAELYKLNPEEVLKLKTAEQEQAAKHDAFFVAVYAGSRVYPDIGKDRNLWRLVLETPAGSVQPLVWEEVPRNQVTRTLFPYIDRWARLFEVKFPKSIQSQTANISLKMVGVPADSTLSWNIDKIRAKRAQSF